MLFVLNNSLVDALKQDIVLEALEIIALARREGKHLIFAERDLLKSLVACSALSKRTRDVYSKLYSQLPQLKTYLHTFSCRIEIIAMDRGLSSKREGNCKIITVPASYFCDSALIQKTLFITENLDDALLYQAIAEIYLKWKKLKGITILFEPHLGGGSTTFEAYQLIQTKKERFCLCVLDSDKKSPNSSLGQTAKKVIKIDTSEQPLCEYFVIGVREIENLIPTALYNLVSEGDPNRMKCIDFLEQLERKPILAEMRKYIDIKEGLKLGEILQATSSTHFSKDWKPLLNHLHPLAIDISKKCINQKICIKENHCDCIMTTGLGDKILKTVVDLIKTPSKNQPTESKIAETVTPLLRTEWKNLEKS